MSETTSSACDTVSRSPWRIRWPGAVPGRETVQDESCPALSGRAGWRASVPSPRSCPPRGGRECRRSGVARRCHDQLSRPRRFPWHPAITRWTSLMADALLSAILTKFVSTSLISAFTVRTVSVSASMDWAVLSFNSMNSRLTVRKVSRPSRIRSANSTGSRPAIVPPGVTTGAASVPRRSG